MSFRKKSLILLCAILSVIHSCSFAPRYRAPAVDTPEHWRFADNENKTIDNRLWWHKIGDSQLENLVAAALHYNKDIAIAISRVAEFKARLGVVSSALFPQLDSEMLARREEASLSVNPGVRRVRDFFQVSASMSYELDLWGKIQNATQASLGELLAQIEVKRSVMLTITAEVVISYIRLRTFDCLLQISRETLLSREQSYNLAKVRYEEGLTSELEVKQAESQVEAAAVEVSRFIELIAIEENLLSILVGRAPSSQKRGLKIDEWAVPHEVPAGLPSELLLQRPDILQAEYLLYAANMRIGVVRAELFPSISLTGLFGQQSLELHTLLHSPSRFQQFGFNLLQPLFTGWRIKSSIAEAIAQKWQAYYQYERVVLNAFREVENALISHRQAKESAAILAKRVAVLQEYLKLAQLQYENGQTDYLNVLDAERSFFAAQLDNANAQAEIFITIIDLYKALGGIWE